MHGATSVSRSQVRRHVRCERSLMPALRVSYRRTVDCIMVCFMCLGWRLAASAPRMGRLKSKPCSCPACNVTIADSGSGFNALLLLIANHLP